MKRFLTVLLVAVTGLALFANGNQEVPGKDDSLDKVMKKGVFVLGLDDSFPPMGYRNDDNEIVGFDIDLAKEVTKRMGVELKCQPIDWNSKEQELATGNIDCIWNGFTITPEREKVLTFTKPYMNNAQVLVVKGNAPYQALADFAGKTIGVQAGSSSNDAIDANVQFKSSLKQIIDFKDNLTALMDLQSGGVDAVAVDLMVATDNIKRSGKDFRILKQTLADEQFGVGFRKGDLALRDKVQEELDAMANDGTMAKISTQWFGSDITVIGK
ncbi:MAG: amino acid ABC transporter substrate-binding protein [Spirochaetia bacterium]|jgi:polar amino acid transport system substrate-binding protein|nr:amino acid ABC transporter substrate-binding protein [Spirochaetia bacterium]